MYKPVDPQVSFPKMEEGILAFWEAERIFQRSIDERPADNEFVFYDGPPFATGLPHFGHFVPGTIKDIVPRYQTMRGKRVIRRFGWDCHGLPVENEIQKSLGISGRANIEAFGVAKFNEECRSIVLRYTAEWRKTITRMGRWVDFDDDYKTMDPDFMETIWWVFKKLWEKGLIYEGAKVLPYSPALATVLSNNEVNLGGYKDVHDPAITVRFRVKADAKKKPVNWAETGGNTYILAWTTTPWTLPSNLALTVGPDIEYLRVKDGKDVYILAKERYAAYYKEGQEGVSIVATMKGSDLAGWSYEPLFPYFAQLDAQGAFRVHTAAFVTTGDGTGVVHTAPGFGEDDYQVLKDSGLPIVCPIDDDCKFTDEVPDYQGVFVKDADKSIIQRLKDEGKLVRRDTILHAYPHCYRTGVPLIYRAISSWFVDIGKIKKDMLAANDQIDWVPSHLQKGRFGHGLESAPDWAISRNRFWGNPIPIWKSDGSDHVECIGSVEELEKKSGVRVTDLHKHFVDDITWPSPDGKGTMRRIPEVLDCWFESGAMPYAQNHYPFENKERVEQYLPADFICESLDQTRGWFYTLTVLAAALWKRPSFRSVVCSGMVLADDGRKMSKSSRNYTDPNLVIDNFGADALRLYLMNSPVTRASDLKYSDEGVKETLKSVLIPLWNAYSFFVTYANIDGFKPESRSSGEDGAFSDGRKPDNSLDLWILSLTETLVQDVSRALDQNEIESACKPIVFFIDQLNNWYIRRSRRRFWKSENDGDKLQAYETLYEVLLRLVRCAAPIIPFVTEEIWRNLRTGAMPESVHLASFPERIEDRVDEHLERRMEVCQHAVTMGRAIRSMHNLKNRQPLAAIHLVTRDQDERRILLEMEDIIRDELNVKEVIFRENEEELVEYSAKANFKVLGAKLGKDMKAAADLIARFSATEISSLLEGSTLNLEVGGKPVEITEAEVLIQRNEKQGLKVLNEGSLTLALDPVITEELRWEGLARDFVRGVQNLRKESGLAVSDRIVLSVSTTQPDAEGYAKAADVRAAIETFGDYIKSETLCSSLLFVESGNLIPFESGELRCSLELKRLVPHA